MSSAHARRAAAPDPPDPWSAFGSPRPAAPRRARADSERRRRQRHLQQLRRDLLVDAGLALVAAVLVLSATAGLGVVVLLGLPVGAAVVASFVLERRARRRRQATQRYRSRRPRPPAGGSGARPAARSRAR